MDGLSPQLVGLLEMHLDSSEKLEIISRVRTLGSVDRASLGDGLEVDGAAFEDAVTMLARGGFLELAGGVVLLGPRISFDMRVARLMDLYENDRFLVMAALTSLTLRRMRHEAATSLAEGQRRLRMN